MRIETCRACSNSLAVITLTIDGASRTMRSCSFCDRREWSDEGDVINLSEVLTELSDEVQAARAASSSS